ncbi:MAG: hypothetical protein COS34_02155 [Lysobacterales bacterium CG02_land_8_20_14_3_00_62_12]|nr:MAG: hypothetical protein COS34_02155 [Xanthomonadales bacterium CG02_land_8_20_14_3_00_62_12]
MPASTSCSASCVGLASGRSSSTVSPWARWCSRCWPGAEHAPAWGVRFHHPHQYRNWFLDPGNQRLAAPYHHGFWNLKLKAGQLILFPSWVPREVMPYYGGNERITIAFNCWFKSRK